jgi:hypothetical protein
VWLETVPSDAWDSAATGGALLMAYRNFQCRRPGMQMGDAGA